MLGYLRKFLFVQSPNLLSIINFISMFDHLILSHAFLLDNGLIHKLKKDTDQIIIPVGN